MSIVIPLPLTAEAASGQLPEAVSHVVRDDVRIVLTRAGEPVAAVVPIADLHALEALDDAEDAHWSRVAEAEIALWEAEGRPPGIPLEDIALELGVDPTITP